MIWKTALRNSRWSADINVEQKKKTMQGKRRIEHEVEHTSKREKNENETFMKCECSENKIMIKMGMKQLRQERANTLDLVMVSIYGFVLCEWLDVSTFKVFNYVFSYYVQEISPCERRIVWHLLFCAVLFLC